MERLTEKHIECMNDFCHKTGCELYGDCPSFERYKRLAAYEDTGLEPEDIKELCTDEVTEVARTFRRMIQSGELAHLQELLNAEQQGRLVVLPCKVGDTVYRLQRYFNDATLKSEVKIKRCTIESINLDSMCTNDMVFLSFENIGKTVFLTRGEAERALEVQK